MSKITVEKKYMDDEGLTLSAQQMLTEKMEAYLTSIITQAVLSESRDHVGNGNREITAAHIVDADLLCRRGLHNKKISMLSIFYRILQLGGSIAVGIGASNFTQDYGKILVFGGSAVGIVAYFLELDHSRKG